MNAADQLRAEMMKDENFRRLAQTLAAAMEVHTLDSPNYDAAVFMDTWYALYSRSACKCCPTIVPKTKLALVIHPLGENA